MLLKRIEDEEQTLAYVDIQRTFQHKRQTLGKMVEYMKKRALMQKERIHQNQNKLREMAVYSKSSNLVIRKREAAASPNPPSLLGLSRNSTLSVNLLLSKVCNGFNATGSVNARN